MSLQPRVVVVHRRSEHEELLMRHGTWQQAAFFLEGRAGSIEDLAARHELLRSARATVSAAIPTEWRRATVERSDLHHFDFTGDDIVVIVGQDGLVANTAKYLDGQPVIGIDPEPDRNAGVLVIHPPEVAARLLTVAVGPAGLERNHDQRRGPKIEQRTMVSAVTDDGQELHALNEVFIGHRSHQSARYRIATPAGDVERQSSSGVLVGTGTGATGWLRSVWQERRSGLELPAPTEGRLCWFVREAWPSIATGTVCTEGEFQPGSSLTLYAESDELVCFGDGIESDALRLTWGQALTVTAATRTLNLVVE